MPEKISRGLGHHFLGWLATLLGWPSTVKLCSTSRSGFMGFIKIFAFNPVGLTQKEDHV